jgi:hypothetical protein
MPYGDDFNFVHAQQMYLKMEVLIVIIRSNPKYGGLKRFKINFATPTDYLNAVEQNIDNLEREDPDFQLYLDQENDIWTGFYSTRPRLKLEMRQFLRIFSSVRNLMALSFQRKISATILNLELVFLKFIDSCSEFIGLVTHDDAITGTCTQEVAMDYREYQNRAFTQMDAVMQTFVVGILGKTQILEQQRFKVQNLGALCNRYAEEECFVEFNESEQQSKSSFLLMFFNFQAKGVKYLELSTDKTDLSVRLPNMKRLPSEIYCFKNNPLRCRLWIELPMKAFETRTLVLTPVKSKESIVSHDKKVTECTTYSLGNQYSISFYCKDENLPEGEFNRLNTFIVRGAKGEEFRFEIDVKYYQTLGGGAYLFKPNALTRMAPLDMNEELSIVAGLPGKQVTQISLIYKTYQIVLKRFKSKENPFEFDIEVMKRNFNITREFEVNNLEVFERTNKEQHWNGLEYVVDYRVQNLRHDSFSTDSHGLNISTHQLPNLRDIDLSNFMNKTGKKIVNKFLRSEVSVDFRFDVQQH